MKNRHAIVGTFVVAPLILYDLFLLIRYPVIVFNLEFPIFNFALIPETITFLAVLAVAVFIFMIMVTSLNSKENDLINNRKV